MLHCRTRLRLLVLSALSCLLAMCAAGTEALLHSQSPANDGKLLAATPLVSTDTPNTDTVKGSSISMAEIRSSATRALTLVEHSASEYLKQRECFSCHHQSMAILTCIDARRRGLAVDQDNLTRQVERTVEHLKRGAEQYRQGEGQGGRVDTAAYALLGLSAAEWPADATTDLVSEYLIGAYADSKRWTCMNERPPTQASDITTSALALKALNAYAPPADHERVEKRRADCLAWLMSNPPQDNEQRVFALFAAQALDRPSDVEQMRDLIVQLQSENGGWSQTSDMASDAYATGTSLYALSQAGYDTSLPVYQRGLRFLLDSQLADGSWHVVTRSAPIQKYFESGFPHGVDQYISYSATAWSTLALLAALPLDEAHVAKLPQLVWTVPSAKSVAASVAINSEQPDATGTPAVDPAAADSGIAASSVNQAPAKQAPARQHSDSDFDFFERDIRPLLLEKCATCHGVENQEAQLRVDSLSALLAGGESGPAVIPSAADRSLLMRAVRREGELKMPPDDALSDLEITKLQQWIELGAPWPEGKPLVTAAHSADRKLHWAFQPVVRPLVPEVSTAAWPRSPIDRFLLAKLEQNELSPAPEAQRRDLLERISYDLTGLPPTAEEQDTFEQDRRPDAYDRVVDRLLASPRFGEQWGRHWLDVARYSDTKGYVYAREERFFVHASAYRDWVIRAFSEDIPYQQFVLLQLAADQVAPDDTQAQAAMGFLTVGRRFLGVTHDIIDDRIDVVSRGLLGLTVACARCHDHKFDPIPTADYYSLYGVFHNSVEQQVRLTATYPLQSVAAPSENPFEIELTKRQQAYRDQLAKERQVAADRVHNRITDYLLSQLELEKYPAEGFDVIIASDDLVPAHVRRFEAFFLEAAERDDAIFSVWRRYQELMVKGSNAATVFAPEDSTAVLTDLQSRPQERVNLLVLRHFTATPPQSMREVAQRYGELFAKLKEPALASAGVEAEQNALAELLAFWEGPKSPCLVPDEEVVSIEQYFDSGVCNALWKLQGEIDRWINQSATPTPFATILSDRNQIREPHIFRRGNPRLVGPRVPRQFLSILQPALTPQSGDSSSAADQQTAHSFQHGSGRGELAQAIVDPRNPLTMRVWTNRLWQHLFGVGLVPTPSDFGLRADLPSHPELLDWIASEYLANGQSTKQAVRQFAMTSAYQQSSTVPLDWPTRVKATESDPANRMLWHASPKRLTFEQLRDTWLMLAQQLDSSRGGRAEPMFGNDANRRRTIYGQVDRQYLPGVLRVFDFANPDLHTPQRSETTVPQQALYGLNNEFVARAASGVARASLPNDTPAQSADVNSSDRRIGRMFRLILGREPSTSELVDTRTFLEQPSDPAEVPRVETLAWQYGFAKFVVDSGTIEGFTKLPYFNGLAWQGGAQLPDANLGWVQLTAQGGHAGNDLDHAAVRRWVAPRDGRLRVRSQVKHEVAVGDGVRCSIVLSRGGMAASEKVHNATVDLNVDDREIKAGDTVDFVIDYHANLNNDQFLWSPQITLVNSDAVESHWNATADFAGPQPMRLDPWEQLAQVLLLSNELMFID